ncbi:MAG: LLM class flavin-dependent oxidoreductase [Chloroflexia bacterium]|nr:LLM class flavin-dependent oxidoreductase [Chloroflexia bacterium]
MVEGQDGLTWPRWQGIARAAEDLGFTGLYRSDHFTNPTGPVLPALELWTSLTWLAGHTERITFGPLVSPLSFRDPVITAWQALAVNDLSGDRLRLGLGAGWQEREHRAFGYDLLDVPGRFARFEEGLETVQRLTRRDGPVTRPGQFSRLDEARFQPETADARAPRIVIGGNGPRRTLPLAARFAAEWNAVFTTAERFAELSATLSDQAQIASRDPATIVRTLMTRVAPGNDAAELRRRLGDRDATDLRERGGLIGSATEIREGIDRYRAAGVEEIMLQWLELDDLPGIERLAGVVIGAG